MKKTTIKQQLIDFVRNAHRPVTRREICNEYKRITGIDSNLALALCYGTTGGIGGFNGWGCGGYLCRNVGYGAIKRIGYNQYIAE